MSAEHQKGLLLISTSSSAEVVVGGMTAVLKMVVFMTMTMTRRLIVAVLSTMMVRRIGCVLPRLTSLLVSLQRHLSLRILLSNLSRGVAARSQILRAPYHPAVSRKNPKTHEGSRSTIAETANLPESHLTLLLVDSPHTTEDKIPKRADPSTLNPPKAPNIWGGGDKQAAAWGSI